MSQNGRRFDNLLSFLDLWNQISERRQDQLGRLLVAAVERMWHWSMYVGERVVIGAVALLAFAFCLTACAAPPSEPVVQTMIAEIPVTVEVEVTREVIVTSEVTRIVELPAKEIVVTATPLPVEVSMTFLDIQGRNDTVTDNLVFPKCTKAVFSWTAGGNGYLMADLINVEANGSLLLINGHGGSGQVLQGLKGGVYYLAIYNASDHDWTILGECRD